MNLYTNSTNIILFLYVLLYPIIPTYNKISTDILVYLMIILQIISFFLIKNERKKVVNIIKNIYKDKIFLSLILLNSLMYLSSFFASNSRISITNSIRFSMYIFIFYLISYKVKNKECQLLFNTLIIVATISGIYTLLQILHAKYLGYVIDKTIRMTSFLENPNNLGAYSIILFFIILMLFISTKNIKYKVLYFISTILLLINIMFSQSRNALIAILIGAFIVAILYDKRLFLLSISFSIIFFLIPAIRSRIYQIFDMSQNNSRFNIWNISLLMIKDKPITGIGYENFSINFPVYTTNNPSFFMPDYLPLHPHNIFLKIQTELGVLGSILFLLFILVTIIVLCKLIYTSNNSSHKAILIGILTSFITFLFMNLLDCFLNIPKVIITLFIILAFTNYYRINYSSKYK